MLTTKWIIHFSIVIMVLMLVTVCEARGGRRGGSMGGLFGSWRKYKKPSSSSSGSSRRIVSSSPVHTPITKALNEKKEKLNKNGKSFNGKYGAPSTPPLPAGGSYYSNAATMPANAVYIAQAPPRGAEFGDFLTGYLTGRLLTMGMYPSYHHHQYITHSGTPNQDAANNNGSSTKIIIIDNNNQNQNQTAADTISTTTDSNLTPSKLSTNPEDSTTISDFDSTSTTSMSLKSFFFPSSTSTETSQSTTTTTTDITPPPYGIICMPLMVNEKNQNGENIPIERIVCYPAPAPATPIQSEMKSKPVEIAGDIVEH